MQAITLTLIEPQSNHCKVYHIDGDAVSYYGRIGCTMRRGVVKATTQREKERKGYVRTMLVQIPYDLEPYNHIKMLRWNAQKQVWIGYGCFKGFYRPIGFEFNPMEIEQLWQYRVPFQRWNHLAPKY